MVTLTLQDKKALMTMLHKHYSIDESAFIKAIAQNEEEEVELTLKAFSLAQRTKEIKAKQELVQEDNPGFQIVQIDHLVGKLELIKAIKETTDLGLADSKVIADQIVSFCKDKLLFAPFKISSNIKVCTLTVNQWTAICTYLYIKYGNDAIKWHYA